MKFVSLVTFILVASTSMPQVSAWVLSCWTFNSFKSDNGWRFWQLDIKINNVNSYMNGVNNKLTSASNMLRCSEVSRVNGLMSTQRSRNTAFYNEIAALEKENAALEKFLNSLKTTIYKVEIPRNAKQDLDMSKADQVSHQQDKRMEAIDQQDGKQNQDLDQIRAADNRQESALRDLVEYDTSQTRRIKLMEPENLMQDKGLANIVEGNNRQDEQLRKAKTVNGKQMEELKAIATDNADQDQKLLGVETGIAKIRSAAAVLVEKLISEIKQGGANCMHVLDMFMCVFKDSAQ